MACKHLVTGLVTVGVIDLFEVVNVQHQHQGRFTGAGNDIDGAVDHGTEMAAVGQARSGGL